VRLSCFQLSASESLLLYLCVCKGAVLPKFSEGVQHLLRAQGRPDVDRLLEFGLDRARLGLTGECLSMPVGDGALGNPKILGDHSRTLAE